MKRTLILSTLAVLALASCSKEEQQVISLPDNVSTFRKINAPDGFDFKGTKTITISLLAQSGAPSQPSTLIKVLDSKENVLLKYKVNPSEGFEIPLEVPASTKELIYEGVDGSRKTINISNNRITLN